MEEEVWLLDSKEDLDFLLNFSRISTGARETSFDFASDKLNLSEKERTREESYEDIMKQLHHTKLEKIELTKQLEALRNELTRSYLLPFQQELSELNEQNIKLRQQLTKTTNKGGDDRCERYSNRSSIKLKASAKSNYGDENKKTNAKPRRNHVSPNSLLKKETKLAESTANLGRSQIQSPKQHRKRESQLTERKVEENNSMGVSVNISVLDDRLDYYNIKESVSKHQLNPLHEQNIFLQILQGILHEEKQHEGERFAPLQECLSLRPDQKETQEVQLVNELEGQIKETNQKLEMLGLVVAQYQKEMGELNVSLRSATEWADKLWEVKGRYLQMQKKCIDLVPLRKQVAQKQKRLDQLKESHMLGEEQKPIPSIETMIKLLCSSSLCFDQPDKLYLRYYREIKEAVRMDKEEQGRRFSKAMKVRETIESIREGRKKFNELIHIYEGRIVKLEEKISKIRCYNQKR